MFAQYLITFWLQIKPPRQQPVIKMNAGNLCRFSHQVVGRSVEPLRCDDLPNASAKRTHSRIERRVFAGFGALVFSGRWFWAGLVPAQSIDSASAVTICAAASFWSTREAIGAGNCWCSLGRSLFLGEARVRGRSLPLRAGAGGGDTQWSFERCRRTLRAVVERALKWRSRGQVAGQDAPDEALWGCGRKSPDRTQLAAL